MAMQERDSSPLRSRYEGIQKRNQKRRECITVHKYAKSVLLMISYDGIFTCIAEDSWMDIDCMKTMQYPPYGTELLCPRLFFFQLLIDQPA